MQDARATLRDELGLDPSQALQQLEKAILLQDPVARRGPGRAAAAPRPRTLPVTELRAAEPAGAEVVARAQRKVVTVLFADVTDSTAARRVVRSRRSCALLLATYFERMKAAAERHGGVVEKFIGDAVMAVFGIPAVHEDDALRALRAAMEMRDGDRRARHGGPHRHRERRGRRRHGASGSSPAAPSRRRRGSSRRRSRARSWSAKGTMRARARRA